MSKVEVKHEIDASAERVWEVLRDFGGVENFHPAVRASGLLSERSEGLGAQRKCEFHDGNWVKERVVGWEDGRSMTIEISEGSMPLSCAEGRLEVRPLDDGRSEVVMTMSYVVKMGPIGMLMDVLMIRSKFRAMVGDILKGLDVHTRTGAIIGRDGKPQPAHQPSA
jgi:hypothetical protein